MTSSTVDRSVLDGLLRETGDDSLVELVLDAYLERAPELTRSLGRAVAAGARPEAAHYAHDLASLSGQVGATALAKLARQIEYDADHTSNALDAQFRHVEQALPLLLAEIAALRAGG